LKLIFILLNEKTRKLNKTNERCVKYNCKTVGNI
jgi:hypothetical protein